MTTPLSGIPVILKLGLAMVNLQHHSIEHMYTSSLLAFHCYYVPMLHRFWNILVENRLFEFWTYPTIHKDLMRGP